MIRYKYLLPVLFCFCLAGCAPLVFFGAGAAAGVAKHLPAWQGGEVNYYYWYYGTHALYHIGSDEWGTWNRALHRALVPKQRADDGKLAGSWGPVGAWCGNGGRVYATAMGALCLEVPYE